MSEHQEKGKVQINEWEVMMTKWKLLFCWVLLIIFGMCLTCSAENIFSVKPGGEFSSPDNWILGRYDQKASLKRRAEAFLKAKNVSRDDIEYLLGTGNSLEKIFQDKYWFKGKVTDEVFIQAAKNEYESFQLCIIPTKSDKAIEGIQLEISDLVGFKGRISKNNIRYYEVGYVKTTRSASPINVIGYWPDPLLENKTFNVKPEEIKPIWIEFYVPPETPAGEYEGTIKVTTTNSHSFLFQIHLTVWDFTLPKKQICCTCTWLSLKNIRDKYGIDREREMYRKYLSYFLEHKINPLRVGKEYYQKNNYKVLDENLNFALGKGLEVFEIPRLKGDELKKFCNHLREKGWFNKAMIYGYRDEPKETDYQNIQKDSAEIKKIEPKLKIFLAESPHPGLYGAIDVWWSSIATENRRYVKERLQVGEEVWWYCCGTPVHCEYNRPYWEYPSDVRINRASIDMRILYWMIWKYKMSPATFFFAGNYWVSGYQNWPSSEWNSSCSRGVDGNGYVVYPGEDGPLPSIRLKCIRDGIEDYQYLYLLKEKVQRAKKKGRIRRNLFWKAENLLAIDNSLIVNTHYYSKDPRNLLEYRLKLAQMIEKLVTK